MTGIGKPERATQQRLIALFRDELRYRFLGDWTDRANSNIEEGLLRAWLTTRGHSPDQISRAFDLFGREATNATRSPYDNNQAVYGLLRYGVKLKIAADEPYETIWLVDWNDPDANDFAIAEEVTLDGASERRPDLVLYLNGIAVGVIELKRSAVSVGDGIRQLISNQSPAFNAWFFSTVQFVFAGNDTEGLRHGTVGTPEKMFLTWKEDEGDNSRYKLDKYLLKLCDKRRMLELMYDFVLFDGGVKKLPRVHQYFGVKAAREYVRRYEGGIIWHTQGSGKSLVMVLLARWILEHLPDARVLIATDRDELDKQIERVFRAGGEDIYRTRSGADLMDQLAKKTPRLLCSLVHKFGKRGVDDFDAFIAELKRRPSRAVGELFIFVDECHRTQTGRLHKTMKALLPGAVFVGFTGTPLLKADAQTSREVFGDYIHTYKFGEAVEDGVVLDLVYEARDIPQELGSRDRIDQWFDVKTRGLNEWQKAALREQWGTMQRVLSSRSRMDRLVQDIVFDFSVKDRLSRQRGNAILVASSIYEACRYFELFEKTALRGKCAVITSYNPSAQDVTREDTGANTDTEKQFLYNTYSALLKDVAPKPGKSKTETYEDAAKERFVDQPANMRLLIVVDKLLTGFDAPSCTYLYIDKSMQDHGLFQAICRTNRLDGEDKTFGYIVDYKDLFKKVQGAMAVYTSELDTSAGDASPEILLRDRLEAGRERLEAAREALTLLREPVPPPKAELEYIQYFCGNTELPDDLAAHEPQRAALYKTVASLVRAYASIADDLLGAGYSVAESKAMERELGDALMLRETIRRASNETIDLKAYEADMRHLIDTYIEAEVARPISAFGETGLLDLIVKSGIAEAIASLPKGIQASRGAVAETIANNVRSTIIRERPHDPAFYDRMSAVLADILADLKAQRIDYETFLKWISELAIQIQQGQADDTPEPLRRSPGLRAIYHALTKGTTPGRSAAESAPEPYEAGDSDGMLGLAQRIDAKLRGHVPNGWRGGLAKEREVKRLIYDLVQDTAVVERLFPIIRAQGEY
ncbi:MAG: HsdR family type I site-specific deoxyribonuclease [bacterium]